MLKNCHSIFNINISSRNNFKIQFQVASFLCYARALSRSKLGPLHLSERIETELQMKWPEMGDQTGSSLGDVEDSHNDDELELFLKSVLDRIQNIINQSEENSTPDVVSLVQELLRTLDCTVSLYLRLTDLNPNFKELTDLHECFLILLQTTREHFFNLSLANTLTSIYSSDDKVLEREHGSGPGRPKIHIPCEMLEDLRGIGFSWSKIAKVFSVSRWTVSRRVKEDNLDELQGFLDISDSELDNIIANYVSPS